jgi:hypothetical protein
VTLPDNDTLAKLAADATPRPWRCDATDLAAEVIALRATVATESQITDDAVAQLGEAMIEIAALRKRVEAAYEMAELIEPYVVCVVATEGGNSYALRAALAAYRATGAA